MYGRSHVDIERARMRVNLAAKAYNSLIEELHQVYFEYGDDPKALKLYDAFCKKRGSLQKLIDRINKGK